MNKKVWLGLGIILVALSFFLFRGESPVTNYPSKGTDIIAFGDSLVEGVGASVQGRNFISLLSSRIRKPIINLGVSGNTTMDGLDRLGELDKYNPKVVILLLGGNDYLKKVPIDVTFGNLEKIIQNIHSRGASVLLLGIRGGLFNDKFDSRFEELSDKYDTAFVSDVLDGLFGNTKYMSDSIHPNDLGYETIYGRVYPVLNKLLN